MAVGEIHQALLKEGIRDEVTVIASGGISLAEHVVKSLLCGADAICIDLPLMIALECRVCMNCTEGIQCPIGLADTDHDYATQRIVNLIGAWHSQMLEMMGAMGIREARRLRGEVGRAMFFDDLERECFAPIFGKRVEA
jgi:glutamate synthase domain-containing protein 2